MELTDTSLLSGVVIGVIVVIFIVVFWQLFKARRDNTRCDVVTTKQAELITALQIELVKQAAKIAMIEQQAASDKDTLTRHITDTRQKYTVVGLSLQIAERRIEQLEALLHKEGIPIPPRAPSIEPRSILSTLENLYADTQNNGRVNELLMDSEIRNQLREWNE